MGYYVDMPRAKFHIPTDKMADALEVLKNKAKEMKALNLEWDWVENDEIINAENLTNAFSAFGYFTKIEPDGLTLQCREFEKYGSDEEIFQLLAPFVGNGSMLEFYSESHDMWRFVFKDGKMTIKVPQIVWD